MVQHGDKAQQQQVRSQEHKDDDAEDGYGYGDAADKGKAANDKRAAAGGSK